MSASMAELIEAHTAEWTMPDYVHYACLCKEVRWHVNTSADYYQAHARHVAEVLAANGYGKLEDAWDECNATDTPWINPYRRPE